MLSNRFTVTQGAFHYYLNNKIRMDELILIENAQLKQINILAILSNSLNSIESVKI